MNPYRRIDTTFFSEQEILSGQSGQADMLPGDEVLQDYHNDNPWRNPAGLQRMHTVSVSTQQGAILDPRQRRAAGGAAGALDQREKSRQRHSPA